jgi:hypothetical protein
LNAGLFLVLLATFDTIITDLGIRHNYIQEANPLMDSLYKTSIFSFYLIKMILPIVLLYILAKIEAKPYIRFLLGASLLLYVIVLTKHLYWMTEVLWI